MTFEEAEARAVVRQGLDKGWTGEDCRDEVVERLRFSPQRADEIVLAVIRERQEHEVQHTHDEIAYDVISRYE